MNKNGMWLPLIASIGVGAATYYSMSRNNQGLDQTLQQFMPGGQSPGKNKNSNSGNHSESLGPFGMS
ncbi:hypothetical protein [Oceanobacillus sp. CAU 1775]